MLKEGKAMLFIAGVLPVALYGAEHEPWKEREVLTIEKQAVKAAMGDGSAEPDLAPNPRIKFQPAWYEELQAAVRELSGVVGFGPTLVQSLAAEIYMAHMGLTEDQLDWMPSKRWVYWFMHHIMGLSVRRVTGHAVSEADLARQNELHDMNLQALAIELSDVDGRPLDPKYIMGARVRSGAQ